MKNMLAITVPTVGFAVATRAALAAGLGLLLSEKLSDTRRRAIGTALVAVGPATTIPVVLSLVRGIRRTSHDRAKPGVRRDERLIGATRFPRGADDEFVS